MRILQNQPGNRIARRRKQQESQRELPLVARQKRHCAMPVFHGQIADPKITNQPGQRDRGNKARERHLEYSSGKHKNLERSRRRQQRGQQHPPESVFLHPVPDCARPLPRFPVKVLMSAFARDEVKQNAAQNGSEGSGKRVQRHSGRMLNRKVDQQQIIDDGKREHRRIEKRNQKETGSSQTRGKRRILLLPAVELRRQAVLLRNPQTSALTSPLRATFRWLLKWCRTPGAIRSRKSHRAAERTPHFPEAAGARHGPKRSGTASDPSRTNSPHPPCAVQSRQSFRFDARPPPDAARAIAQGAPRESARSAQCDRRPAHRQKFAGWRLPPRKPAHSPCKNARGKRCASGSRCGTPPPRDPCRASRPSAENRP